MLKRVQTKRVVRRSGKPKQRKRAGFPCVKTNALAMMKMLCQDHDRRMAAVVLNLTQTSKQAGGL